MGRRHSNRPQPGAQPQEPWEVERTLAAAEEDEREAPNAEGITSCTCGSNELLLEAYLQVVDGRALPVPVELETLTCPQCGREYEAIQAEDGRILRGGLLGTVELDDDDQ